MLNWLTKAEVDAVIQSPKEILEEIIWMERKPLSLVYFFKVNVTNESNLPLTFEGSYNARNENFLFKIMYAGTQRIKCLCMGKTHRNPDGERIGKKTKKHKHTWTDEHADQWVYDPEDITPFGDLKTVFQEFLLECNMVYNGSFNVPNLNVQLELEL